MNEEKKRITEYKWYSYPQIRNALFAGFLTGFTIILEKLHLIPPYLQIPLFILAIVVGGYYWIKEGIEELIECRKVGIELLMLAATTASAILGMWEEAALLVFIYGAAEGLEGYTFAKARTSIRKLLDLAPKEARLIRDGKEIVIPAEKLQVGDLFLVRPGESLATDGVIIKGESTINEAPVTGESIPVYKRRGAKVFAATINGEGALEIQVTAAFTDNTLSKMVHLVEEAEEKKSKQQQFIDRFGKKYSPTVLIIGLLMLFLPPLFGQSFSFWAVRAVVFFVAAAPCALIMSTPITVATGIGTAGKHGVLIKGGVCLESLGKINAVAFDKTGTLTKGKPVVTDIFTFKGQKKDLLSYAYGVEYFSEHPLALAIVEKAINLKVKKANATEFKSLTGNGAQARIENELILVGKKELFSQNNKAEKMIARFEGKQNGKTLIYVGTHKSIIGAIAIEDQIRSDAKEMIARLHDMGIKVAMLTGDNKLTAKAIAEELGIDDVKANLMPEDKIKAIESLKKEYGHVAMIGDGVNDAPALASATIGIAMGTAGTDAAIEAADIALMGDKLKNVPYAINLGKRARSISRQNIIFSLALLAVLIPSALIGVMTVAIAVLVHEVGELLAIGNGLRVATITKHSKRQNSV
ncbi:cation-translocating P-type ATPase [Patescibacteria group bacterium]|nr:cation-translocating P-type ATPase [Patescibacteria group bacterium]